MRFLRCLALPGEGERAVLEGLVCKVLASVSPELRKDIQSRGHGEGGGMNDPYIQEVQTF